LTSENPLKGLTVSARILRAIQHESLSTRFALSLRVQVKSLIAAVFLMCGVSYATPDDCNEAIARLHSASRKGDPVILGAGPVGSNLAIRLADLGYSPVVVEKRPDPRLDDPDSGRTFNITLANRGVEAMPEDVRLSIMGMTSPSRGRMLHLLDGSLMHQLYGRLPEHQIHAIGRIDLQKGLVSAAENRGVNYIFDANVVNVDLHAGNMALQFVGPRVGSTHVVPMPLAIGTDGVNSILRPAIAKATGTTEDTTTLSSGYRAFQLPPGHGGVPVFEHGWLHLWPREDMVITGIPNKNGSFSMILVLPNSGPVSFERMETPLDYDHLFRANYPDLLEINSQLPSLVHGRPLGLVRRAGAERWNFGRQYLVMGDAAHAMSYYFGQGTNVGLEDSAHFTKMVEESDLPTAIERFGAIRKPQTDIVQDLSDGNQKVLSDKAAKADFNFRLKLENEMVRRFPNHFRLRYEYVVFSTIDLRIGNQRIQVQEGIMDELTNHGQTSLEQVDWKKAEELVYRRLNVVQ
jgi:kynurenine 3-monooxygenase